MKTKLSRFGRSSVSVILAVMMLLSTMLVGTVSTVNAADLSNATKVYLDSTVATVNSEKLSTWSSIYAYAYDTSGVNTYTDQSADAVNSWPGSVMYNEGNGIYSIYVDNSAANIIFNNNGGTQTGNLRLPDNWKTTPMIYRGDGTGGSDGWAEYSTSVDVADSVSLNASASSVKVGTEVTLTASLNNKASGLNDSDVTYTFELTSGTTVTGTTNGNTYKFTPNTAGDYTFKVTASANNYNSITGSVTVKATSDSSDKYAIHVKLADNVNSYSFSLWAYGDPNETNAYGYDSWDKKETFNIYDHEWHDYQFIKDVDNWNLIIVNNVTEMPYKNGYKSDLWITVTGTNNYDVSTIAPTPTYKVTYGVNGGNGTLTSDVATGSSVDQGTSVTFTANPNTGYEVEGWYTDEACTDTNKITDAGTSATYETTVNDTTTVYVKFKASTFEVSYNTDGSGFKVSDLVSQADYNTSVTFSVTADESYQIDSVTADNDVTVTKNEDGTYSFTMPAGNVKITVTASKIAYNLNATGLTDDEKLSFKVGDTADATTANYGDTVTVSGSATGKTLTAVKVTYGDDTSVEVTAGENNTFTFAMPASAVTVTPTFTAVSYNITVTEDTNYTVTVKESADYNSKVSVTVTAANDAYEVDGITVTDKNGSQVSVGGGESGVYTFTMPASDVTVKANSKLTQIEAPTVTFNVLGQPTADANVLGSTLISATYEAAANSTIVGGSENVDVTDADGTKVSTDKYSLVKDTVTGNYTFTANEPGTYKLSYTVTAKSNYDESMTATNSPVTVTVTVNYTDTQNAYLALEEYVNTVKNTTSDGYTTDSFATFSAALTSAQALLTGLPAADATNASDYTNAKTALETAFSGLENDVTYYIGGRFKGQSWSSDTNTMPFEKVEGKSNLYKYETEMTVSQLSATVSSDNSQKQYFFIHTGEGRDKEAYYASESSNGYNFQNNTVNNQLTLKKHAAGTDVVTNYIKFDNTSDTSSNVVIYLDTSDKDNFKLYYSADIDPDYRITGSLANAGGWSGKFALSMKFDTLEADGSYSKEVSVLDTDITSNANYFRLISKDNNQYGPYYGSSADTDVNICSFNTKDNAYGTHQNSNTAFYFNDAGTYKIHYFVNTSTSRPSVWVEKVSTEYNVTVGSDVSATVDKAKAAKGETVTITATPESGKVLDTVTVTVADGTTVEATVSGNTAIFTMPDQDVTVTAVTFRDAKKCKVTFSSNNDDYGTVSATYNGKAFTSGTEVTEGDKVTFTATAKDDCTFVKWTVNDTTAVSTDNPFTISINSDTTVVADFDDDPGTLSDYYILWGTNASFSDYKAVRLYLKNGQYYAKFDVESDGISTGKDYFFVFSTTNTTSGVTAETGNVNVTEYGQNDFYFQNRSETIENRGYTKFSKIYNSNSDLLSFKVIVSDINLSTKKLTYSCEPTFDVAPSGSVEITAKDGTIRSGYATTADLADTTIEVTTPEGKTLKVSDSFSGKAVTVKKVPDKSTVKVTTTIDESKTFAGVAGSEYYVKGFSVNGIFGGVLSQSEGEAHDSNVYTFEFTVDQELYNATKLEITPVYFLKDDSNCVYFYIENYEAASGVWGNTPACYVYYSGGSEAFGYYPGQPMVDYNGSIFTQIPKYVGGDTSKKITGMTLNNYVWDDVHANYNGKNQKNDNAQTYDYDDFVQISESGAQSDNIIYRYKYNTTDNIPQATLSASTCDPDGWEVFLDYQNYPTDIFGNKLGNEKLDYKDLSTVTDNDEYLSIISNGYQENYIGKYATAWNIYNKAGNRVATIPSSALLYALGKTDSEMTTAIESASTPSDFLPGKTDRDTHWATFKSLYQTYKGVYAQINFEGALSGGADYGNRLDGRWYYSQDKQAITGEIKIQYANTLDDYKDGSFSDDTFADDSVTSITGQTTGAEAYFTDPEDKVRKVETTADNTQNYKFEVQATSTATYTFVGWYRLIDGDYKAINPSDVSSLTGAVTRNSDVTLVARYIKTPGGSMTFHHALYTGENAGGGKAATEIQVVVKDSESNVLYNSDKIAGTASIDKDKIAEFAKQEGLTVTVTLYTTTKNLYDLNGYYAAENTTDITEFAPSGLTTTVTGNRNDGIVTTSEYTFSFNDYYTKYADTLVGDNPGTVYYNFYSDITSIKVPYKVQFSYIDRMGATKYYNKAGYVDPDNTSSYTLVDKDAVANGVESHAVEVTLTNSFILSLAPYESNFAKNLTWNETPKTNVSFDSSVEKSIASAVVESTQYDKTIHLNVFRDDAGNATPLDNDNGTFVPFQKNGSAELPYNSVFYTQNDDGTYTYDITAPETYTNAEGKELKFMYWAVYADVNCKNLVIKAYNIDSGFGYVSFDNYWIVPVYDENSGTSASVKEVYTSTQFMEATRNQWTADISDNFDGFDADSMASLDTAEDFIKGNGEDKLYADFVLNFFYNGKQLNVFDPKSENVQTGIVMQKLDLDTVESGYGYNTDMEHYANKYSESELSNAAADAKEKILTGSSEITSLTKQIDNSRLDNKNRLQYYARFNNTESNANCVYRVYTYVKYVDNSGNTVVELGDPIYFTLYDVANATV